MKPLEEKIFLNVGGLRYETYASTLQVFPGTKLCRLTEPQAAATFDYDPDTKEYFFDRSSYLFEEVLNYYRTKELHCSDLICKSVLDEELAYWGLDNTLLAPCCWQKLIIVEGQKEEYGIPEENQEAAGLLEQAGRNQSAWRGRWQSRIWTTFEKPFSSLSAKVLAAVCLLFNIGICCLFIAKAFEDANYFPVYIMGNQINLISALHTEEQLTAAYRVVCGTPVQPRTAWRCLVRVAGRHSIVAGSGRVGIPWCHGMWRGDVTNGRGIPRRLLAPG
ncbi:potassium voltage-gated channel subfamily C member 3-like [Crotalus adamanteus]|uniref:Potassium voltage-gated channel subfamily C member 3-like n=1 Tax=Crotalus adamanteus TaxID=8729 RepID=A0AAW1AUY0_CROAD